MHFSSYVLVVAAMGYSPADDAVIDTGGTTVWRVSRRGNPCRFSPGGAVRVTVCSTKRGVMDVENQGSESHCHGPCPSFHEAITDADVRIFNNQ
jgi:hypothetical protein